MVVGIDASRANAVARTGVERYSYCVIQELKQIVPTDCRVVLYSEGPLRGELGDLPENWESRVLEWPCRYFWAELRLGWEMLVRRPDVLFQPGRALPLVLPPRAVATLHDVGFAVRPRAYSTLNRWYQYLTTWLYLLRARIITVSQFTADEVQSIFGPARHGMRPIPLGVDSGRYAAAADDPDSVSRVLKRHDIKGIGYLLYVGRLEDKKNVSGLLAAYEILHLVLKEETPELVLVGSRGRGADEALAGMSAAARSRVRLLGFTDDDDLPFIYAGALALFFPSFYEGFGLPVLEAFGARIPVLCSKVASLPEVAGGAAEYLDPTVNQQMAEALLRICQDAGRRRELVERGTARLSGFTWRRVAERTWQEIGGGF